MGYGEGKWPSGRRRQTVNLLVNSSRWFESNLSQMNLFKKLKWNHKKNHLNSKRARRLFRLINQAKLRISVSQGIERKVYQTSPLRLWNLHRFAIFNRSIHSVKELLSSLPHVNKNQKISSSENSPLFYKYRSTKINILRGPAPIVGSQIVFPAVKNNQFYLKSRQNKKKFFGTKIFYSESRQKIKLQNFAIAVYSKINELGVSHFRLHGISPNLLNPYICKLAYSSYCFFWKKEIRRLKRIRRLVDSQSFRSLRDAITPKRYQDCLGQSPLPVLKLTSFGTLSAYSILIKTYIAKALIGEYLLSPQKNLFAIRLLAAKHRFASALIKLSSLSYIKMPELSPFFFKSVLFKWFQLLRLYEIAPVIPRAEVYLRTVELQKTTAVSVLHFCFKRHRLVVTLGDDLSRHFHFFVSVGLFIKYFKYKKSLKRTKPIKLLMMRFLRKVLLVLKFKALSLRLRGVPLYFDSLMTTLAKPLSHAFVDPISYKTINEVGTQAGRKAINSINFTSVRLDAPKPFGSQKTRKRGRIKRKIRRKITRLVRLID